MSQQEPKGMITRNDIFQSWLRWLFFAHANYNWERYQGTGFAHAMAPIIKKLYKTPEDIKAALKRHLVFFNTEPDTGGVIHGMTIALEEQRAMGNTAIDDETINNVKTGLMGPFAGLGDTLKQGIWFSVWQSIGIGLALGGAGILGPIVYIIAASFYTLVFGWWVYYQGYVQGQALVMNLLRTGLLDDVRTGAGVLGAVVLGALGAQFVTVSTGINWTVVTGSGADAVTQTFGLQTQLFDALYPKLLPLATILLVVWLLRRGTSAVSVILYLFGITLASVLVESVSRYAVADQSAFAVFSKGFPTLIGIVVLVVGALWAGSRAKNMSGAINFLIGFAVVLVLFAFLSVGRTEPLQLLSHF
jgi:PTS system mannose-specific IID component